MPARTYSDGGHDHQLSTSLPDRGSSLVEVLVSVVLMATVLVPLLAAVLVNVSASSLLRQRAEVETVLQNAADRVNRAPKRCDYAIYASAAAQTEGWPADRAIVEAWHYVPGATPAVVGTWVAGACGNSSPSELEVQKVRISVTSPEVALTRSIEVVKSDV